MVLETPGDDGATRHLPVRVFSVNTALNLQWTESIGGSGGGVTRAAPLSPIIFHFHAVSGKKICQRLD